MRCAISSRTKQFGSFGLEFVFNFVRLFAFSIDPTSKYHFSCALIVQKRVNIHPYSYFSIDAGNRTRRRARPLEIFEAIQIKINYF